MKRISIRFAQFFAMKNHQNEQHTYFFPLSVSHIFVSMLMVFFIYEYLMAAKLQSFVFIRGAKKSCVSYKKKI